VEALNDIIRMKNKGANNSLFGGIAEAVISLASGLRITLNHFVNARKHRQPIGIENADYFGQDKGLFTLQYPLETIPIPDNGRYRLYNEIDDCIVCDLCAKICPVDCIDIEVVKSTEEIGKTSDGTTKRLYAAKFDIDMAKCCYCGLCTTVCPTECLTMTKTYDYSEYDITNMVYHFTDLTLEQAEQKKKEYEEKQKQKQAAKAEDSVVKEKPTTEEKSEVKPNVKPIFKPVIKMTPKPPTPPKNEGEEPEIK